jgi:glutaredoxin 3
MKVKMYSKQNCGYCVKAKTWFKSKNISYKEIDLSIEENRNEFIKNIMPDYPNAKTVPQIFVNDIYVGGFDNLMEKQDWVLSQLND